MWTRQEMKFYAKQQLKTCYWKALLVSFVVSLATGGFSYGSVASSMRTVVSDASIFSYDPAMLGFAAMLGTIAMVMSFAGIAIGIFLGGPLNVGASRFYLTSAQGNADLGVAYSCFRKGEYMNYVAVMFLRNLFIGLWSLLFIIPGIVKSYQYRFVPYILAENPNMDYRSALDLSRQMTDGQKGDMFILDLSFIGWYLLGILATMVTCGIGAISFYFLAPYVEATFAQLYMKIKNGQQEQPQFQQAPPQM